MESNQKLTRENLLTLEAYSEQRATFRAQVIEHKKHRQVKLGPHATLYFEDALTMKYQIQEMLRVEKIFTAAEINEELETYNPLIPDGSNWKATFMIEYSDIAERRAALATMGGIEHTVWVKIGDDEKICAIANEDLERSSEEKASAVHFMRFEIESQAILSIRAGAPVQAGIDHPALPYRVDVSPSTLTSLARDFAD